MFGIYISNLHRNTMLLRSCNLKNDGQETYIVNLFLFDTMKEVSVLTKSLHIAPKTF